MMRLESTKKSNGLIKQTITLSLDGGGTVKVYRTDRAVAVDFYGADESFTLSMEADMDDIGNKTMEMRLLKRNPNPNSILIEIGEKGLVTIYKTIKGYGATIYSTGITVRKIDVLKEQVSYRKEMPIGEADINLMYGKNPEEKIIKILKSVDLKKLTRRTVKNMLKKVEHILIKQEDYELLGEIKKYLDNI